MKQFEIEVTVQVREQYNWRNQGRADVTIAGSSTKVLIAAISLDMIAEMANNAIDDHFDRVGKAEEDANDDK